MLVNLTSLVLYSNEIETFPTSIEKLTKLKVLDCSRNKLTMLPEAVGNLPELTSLNLSFNKLKAIPAQKKNKNLSILNLSHNLLETFPDICYAELEHLSELDISHNKIETIPNDISCLQSLKIWNMSDNRVSEIPVEVANCRRLKELDLKGNKLKDNRLKKLVEQCRTKQILEYAKSHCGKSARTGNTNERISENEEKLEEKMLKNESRVGGEDTSMDEKSKYIIKVKRSNTLSIKIGESVEKIRPFIAGCIVRNVSLKDDNFKKFIKLQTKLHDGICDKRRSAAIATHDLKLIPSGDLLYTALNPADIEIKPLNGKKTCKADELLAKLKSEAENLRKEKKRNVVSGIHKYLHLLDGKSNLPCLSDSSGIIISLPPLTNSDITKMSSLTDSMLIEVTSSVSTHICKTVLDELLRELMMLGPHRSEISEEIDSNDTLIVEQVKVIDMEGNTKLLYPSRTDLNFEDEQIKVVYETSKD
ncbi:leucine-rich repeat-containing protein 47-like isoform X2 [Prorops nasuta]